MSEEPVRIGLADIADVVTTPSDGQLPLIVGGQAVNIWAVTYAPKVGEALGAFEPFVSKDIDLYGPQKILFDLAAKYNVPVTLSPPRLPGIGQVIVPKGDLKIKVELLNGVNGLRQIGEENAVKISVQGITVRVLDPISCLKAKIANAAGIDQTTRQDVKHIQIMKMCAREYAKDILMAGEQKILSERSVVDLLQNFIRFPAALRLSGLFKNGASLSKMSCPWKPLKKAPWEKCRTSTGWGSDGNLVSPASVPLAVGCARNAFVDLRTGEIETHSREHLITKFVGANFNPVAMCPRWEQFIEEIFPDPEIRRFVWKAAGYSLTGLTSEHYFMFLHGRGANGKSTFLEILCTAFGDYAGRAGSRLIYATDHHGPPDDQIAELFGKRLIIASETAEGVRLQEGLIKDITGGDTLRGCRKYEHGFSFQSRAKLWLAGNHKPAIRGTDDGIWRRVRLIPFERQFGPEERDESLRGKLLAELPSILNWLVQGAMLWQQEGLNPPEIVKAAVEEYRSEEDTLADFIEDCTRKDRNSNTLHSELFKAYQRWSAETGVKFPLSSKMLAKRLRERGWRDMRTAESKCVWRGIALEE